MLAPFGGPAGGLISPGAAPPPAAYCCKGGGIRSVPPGIWGAVGCRKRRGRRWCRRSVAGICGPETAAALSAAADFAKKGGPKQPTPKEHYEAAGTSKSFTSTGDTLRDSLLHLDLRRHQHHQGHTPAHAHRLQPDEEDLAAMGYYGATIFHRSFKNFMVQVGPPPATNTLALCTTAWTT
ncbi:hypothetical protein HaLaN_06103, partial [Haematococcus lacustris]